MKGFLLTSMMSMVASTRAATPVQVFILAGQSNMEGQAIVDIKNGKGDGNGTLEYAVANGIAPSLPVVDTTEAASLRAGYAAQGANFSELRDEASGNWTSFDDVYAWYNENDHIGPLTVGMGFTSKQLGPELGFGARMRRHYTNREQLLLVKVAWGGTTLAGDWRPPRSVAAAGGTVGWCYSNFTAIVHQLLERELSSTFPQLDLSAGYEIKGFGWHQGWNDGLDMGMVQEYAANLENLIRDVRDEFGAPNMVASVPVSGQDSWAGKVDRRLGCIQASPPALLGWRRAPTRVCRRAPARRCVDVWPGLTTHMGRRPSSKSMPPRPPRPSLLSFPPPPSHTGAV